VAELRCGVRIKRFTVDEIRRSISEILGNQEYKENCRRVADSLKEAGGFVKAVECIKEYVKTKSGAGSS
jgi:UDP:flavonoid glycosyltransferase YjiC (YdhE family)